MTIEKFKQHIYNTLSEHKAIDLVELDVSPLTDITHFMLICSSSSKRHAKALANYVIETSKLLKQPPLGIEGNEIADWILVDLDGVVVHIMQAATRDYYQLEKLWNTA